VRIAPGVPPDAYAHLIRLAAARGVPVVLDSSGEALARGVRAGPDVVKPNAAELTALVPGGTAADVLARGARAVVVSRGPLGLLAVTGAGAWHAAPAEPLAGNPTGAGDACVAALARGLRDSTPWPQLLADAVALSAAAVTAPVAGVVDPDTYRRLRPGVRVTALPSTTVSG
jgi:tagatose 6-phosphate kinase